MCHSHQRRFRQQFDFLRRQFLQDGELPPAGLRGHLRAPSWKLDRVSVIAEMQPMLSRNFYSRPGRK